MSLLASISTFCVPFEQLGNRVTNGEATVQGWMIAGTTTPAQRYGRRRQRPYCHELRNDALHQSIDGACQGTLQSKDRRSARNTG